jgi:hypothetical protein
MPKNARCCVDGCDNDERYPCKFKIRSNAGTMKFFKFTKHTKKEAHMDRRHKERTRELKSRK